MVKNLNEFNIINGIDFRDLGLQLAGRAAMVALNHGFKKEFNTGLADGFAPEDIAQEVIIEFMQGKSGWSAEKGDPLPYLKRIVFSRTIDNLRRLKKRHRLPIMIDLSLEPPEPSPSPISPQKPSTPEEIMIQKETEQAAENLINRLIEETDKDPALNDLVDVIMGECEPVPREIANVLGISVSETNNRLKRARRIAHKLEATEE